MLSFFLFYFANARLTHLVEIVKCFSYTFAIVKFTTGDEKIKRVERYIEKKVRLFFIFFFKKFGSTYNEQFGNSGKRFGKLKIYAYNLKYEKHRTDEHFANLPPSNCQPLYAKLLDK